jgi:hypothetical protein
LVHERYHEGLQTRVERERKISQKDASYQWRIFLTHVSDNDVVEPGELSPVFLEVLQRQNRSFAVETYRKEYSDFLTTKRSQNPNNFVYRQATHIEEVATHVFVSALQSVSFSGKICLRDSHD